MKIQMKLIKGGNPDVPEVFEHIFAQEHYAIFGRSFGARLQPRGEGYGRDNISRIHFLIMMNEKKEIVLIPLGMYGIYINETNAHFTDEDHIEPLFQTTECYTPEQLNIKQQLGIANWEEGLYVCDSPGLSALVWLANLQPEELMKLGIPLKLGSYIGTGRKKHLNDPKVFRTYQISNNPNYICADTKTAEIPLR